MTGSSFSLALDIFAAPSNVFNRIRERQLSSWLPLLVLIASALLITGWYMMTVDLYQFMETSMQISGQTVAASDLELILEQSTFIQIGAIVQVLITVPLVFALIALYFFLASALLAEEKFKYSQFFALTVWGSVPQLLSYLSIALSYFLASDFVYLPMLDKTSVASILGMGLDAEHLQLWSSLSIGAIWSFILYGVGYQRLTRSSTVTAVIVALIPPAVQFGLLSLV